jgi:ATP-dependent DNA helicase PIF1
MDSYLSPEQIEIFERIKNRENVFMTGPGGSGKTFLIREIYNWYTQRDIKNIQVCALTGCAAVLLQCNAKTIHSWAGIGLANGDVMNVINNVSYNKFKRKKWLNTDILIIDEVSMLSSKLLSILDGIAKKVRKNNLPFGGIQLLFSGDFYQLPPVGNSSDPETMQFCFESPIWNTLFHKQISLKQIFRQTDQTYSSVLNQIREGRLNKSGYELLMSRCVHCDDDTIRPTKILPRRNDVNRINEMEMSSLKNEERKYTMEIVKTLPDETITISVNPEQIKSDLENLKNNLMAEKELTLKVGAQVMCIVNMDTEGTNPIVNGSRGVVIDFTEAGIPIVKFKCGLTRPINYHIWELECELEIKKGYGIKQIPLILAWAITIHKSQGSTLELAEIDIGNGIFECGQSYVALSRVKDINGLYLRSFNPSKIRISKKVQDYYKTIK